MIPVMQRKAHTETAHGEATVIGDCFNAAVASVLELPYEDVPHFVEIYHDEPPDVWHKHFVEWAKERGWWALHYGLSGEDFETGEWVPPGYWIASVTTPRNFVTDDDGDPGAHAVVMYGRDLVHDPHPGPHRGEHKGFRAAFVFVPLDPAKKKS
jgi:hypothetical protein